MWWQFEATLALGILIVLHVGLSQGHQVTGCASSGPPTVRGGSQDFWRLQGGYSDVSEPDYFDNVENRNNIPENRFVEGDITSVDDRNATKYGSEATGMVQRVDPMVIDDDIFVDGSASEFEMPIQVLGSPPEPPAKKEVYIPNSLYGEDDEERAKIPLVSMERTSGSPNVNDFANSVSATTIDEIRALKEMTREQPPEQSQFLQEALKGAIEKHKDMPTFVPSIAQAVRGTFGPFRFKGFGYSCMKPLNKIPSIGLGLRVPISPCFPQYDANVGLPRLSSMLSLWITDEETYLRLSFSTSLPSRVVFYYLTYLGFKMKLLPRKYSETIRSQRAQDSIKRVGCTTSIRLGSQTGLRWAIGPWLFYLPGKKVMTRVLPVIFSTPAVVLAVLNLFLDMESALGWILDLDPASFRNRESVARSRSFGPSPFIDFDDDLQTVAESRDAAVAAVAAGADDASEVTKSEFGADHLTPKRAVELVQLLPSDIALWHDRLLRWAATKTTGLGFNAGYSKTQKQDASMRQSVAFDIQPFFPSLDLVPMVVHKMSEIAKNMGSVAVRQGKSRNGKGGSGEEREGEREEDLYGSYQLNQVRLQRRRVRPDQHERNEERADGARVRLKRRSTGRPIKAGAKKKGSFQA